MKTLKQLFFFRSQKKHRKIIFSKKDANLNYNATLWFQVSLFISMGLVLLVVNSVKGEIIRPIPITSPDAIEDTIFYQNYVIETPQPKLQKSEPSKPETTRPPEVKPIAVSIKAKTGIEKPTFPETTTRHVVKTPKKTTSTTTEAYDRVEEVPVFPGCESLTSNEERRACMSSATAKWVQRRFDASLANEVGLTGVQRIYVNFIVDTQGQITQVQARGPHPRLEQEAGRVVGKLPKMTPGKQQNIPVNVSYSLPIAFKVN